MTGAADVLYDSAEDCLGGYVSCSSPLKPIWAGLSSSGCTGVEGPEVVEMMQKQESLEISFAHGKARNMRKGKITYPGE